MNKLLEAYKEFDVDGVLQYLSSYWNDRDDGNDDGNDDDNDNGNDDGNDDDNDNDNGSDVGNDVGNADDIEDEDDEAYLENIDTLEDFLYENYRAYREFPQTLLSALNGSEFMKEPHIQEWYRYLKDTLKREPVLPLWKQPKTLESKKSTYKVHADFIQGLVQLEDNCFATSSEDGEICLWEYKPSQGAEMGDLCPIGSLEGHDGMPVNSLAYNPQRRLIASAGDDCKVKLWNRDTHECVAVLEGHTNYVSYLVMGEQLLYSASRDKRVGVWDLDRMTNVAYLTGHQDSVVLLSLSPDNTRLLSTSSNGDLFEWDAMTFILRHKINEGGKVLVVPGTDLYILNNAPEMAGHDGHPEGFQWLSNNRLVTIEHELVLWDTDKWSILKTFGKRYFSIKCFLVINDYIVTFEHAVKIYDITSETLLKAYPLESQNKIMRAVFNEKEQIVITCSEKGEVTIWDWKELLNSDSGNGLGADINSIEVFKDPVTGHEIALCGGFTWDPAVFDLETGELTQRIKRPAGAQGSVNIKKHSVTEQAVLLFEKHIGLMDPFHPEKQQLIPLQHNCWPDEILATRHGLLAGSNSYPPYRVNTKNQKVITYDTRPYRNFIESPDGRYAVATTRPVDISKDGVPFNEKVKPLTSPVVILNLEKGTTEEDVWYSELSKHMKVDKKLEKFVEKNFKKSFPLYPTTAAWAPDGRQVAIGFNKGKLVIYDMKTRRVQKRNELEAEDYIAYMAWTEPHILTVLIQGTVYAVDSHTLKVVKSMALSVTQAYHYTSFGGGRYLVWGNRKRKIIGIFDMQEFGNKWIVSLPEMPSSALVHEGRMLVGCEDGLLYAYSIDGMI